MPAVEDHDLPRLRQADDAVSTVWIISSWGRCEFPGVRQRAIQGLYAPDDRPTLDHLLGHVHAIGVQLQDGPLHCYGVGVRGVGAQVYDQLVLPISLFPETFQALLEGVRAQEKPEFLGKASIKPLSRDLRGLQGRQGRGGGGRCGSKKGRGLARHAGHARYPQEAALVVVLYPALAPVQGDEAPHERRRAHRLVLLRGGGVDPVLRGSCGATMVLLLPLARSTR